MDFTTLKIPGAEAIRLLNEHRSRYSATGQYPFLIGDETELEMLKEVAEFSERNAAMIISASFDLNIAKQIAERQSEAEEDGWFSPDAIDEVLGNWPDGIVEKGSIGLHKDVLSQKVKPEIYLGLAKIEKAWHLPAVLKYGNWNDCPGPEIHCAFHREWHEAFGAEITGMSHDVVECTVRNPPTDQKAALALAWEQYWYCSDIVYQGCGSVSYLAATLMNSPYWYFWWD